MARMGDWRGDQAEEIPLDGIGGVNIIVKADVHRSGKFDDENNRVASTTRDFLVTLLFYQASTSPATPLRTRPKQRASRKWQSVRDTASMDCPTTWYGILIRRRNPVTHEHKDHWALFRSHTK